MISEDLKVHFTNKLNGDLIIANDINELKDKHNKGIDELVQLEQNVNVLRGDVQGVKFDYNKGNKLIFPAGYLKGKSLCWWSNLDSTKTEFGYQSNSVLLLGEPIFGHNSKRIGLGVTEASSSNTFYDPYLIKAVQNNKYKFFCLTFGDVAELYIDGVRCANKNNDNIQLSLTKELVFCVASALHNASIVECYQDITNIRTFNTVLTQQQIDFLYNQGRCDEVVLGDEWRVNGDLGINIYESWSSYGTATVINDYVRVEKTSGELSNHYGYVSQSTTQLNNVINKKATVAIKYTARCGLNNTQKNYVTGFNVDAISNRKLVTLTSEWQDFYLMCPASIVGTPSRLLILGVDAGPNANASVGDYFEVKNISCVAVSLLNEYLPKYLTATKWIDNGVNKQDIALTAPTFSYIRPYKQHLFGSGAPSIIPDAAFTEYSDTATGNIWKCGTKPNTRQFAVSDWKQINN